MPPLHSIIQQRNATRLQLAQLENETNHLAASLIQGCFLIKCARQRLRVERSLAIIRSASSRTLRRWLDVHVDAAPLFINPTITSILYADYRKLLHRRDVRRLFSLQSLELCIRSLADRIAADHYQSATEVQRRFRGTRGRARYKILSDDRKRNRRLRNESATKIQRRIRGFQQRQRYQTKLLEIFERQQLQKYQEERQVDKERRERAELRAKMMKLYVHERQLDESRRLFGSIYAKAGTKTGGQASNIDDTDELAVTLTSCSRAYLAGDSGYTSVPKTTQRCSGADGLSRNEKSRLIWTYNRDRWKRRTR